MISCSGAMDHYFARQGPEKPDELLDFTFPFRGRVYLWTAAPGVFSARRLDDGAALLSESLLESGLLGAGRRLLDLGCGTGTVAVLACGAAPGTVAVACDVNGRAVWCAAANGRRNGVDGVLDVAVADGAACFADGAFDVVVCNPPSRTGNATVLRLLADGARVLRPGGTLLTVMRVKQGAKRLAGLVGAWFATTIQAARGKGYLIHRFDGPRPQNRV